MRKNVLTLFSLFFLFLTGSGSAQDTDPYLFVLGVAQDAGYPQAGCYAEHCMPGWEDPSLRRGATSIALIIPRAGQNYLFDASPDLPEQLYRLRNEADYSLAGVFLTHAHIGHYTGLIYFGREAMGAQGIPVYAMPRMHNFLESNGPWDQLVKLTNIRLRMMQNLRSVAVPQAAVIPFLVPHRDEYSETVGFRIEGPNKTALFIPDIDKWEDWDTDIVQLITEVDYALLDATFYADGELGNRDMSQIPHPFASESMALFENLSAADKSKVWFIHLNHTNPLLNADSEESQFVREQGYNIATEGVKLPL